MIKCKICNNLFEPIKSNYFICYSCWLKQQRKCKLCGKLINDLPLNYKYCNDCDKKIFHSK